MTPLTRGARWCGLWLLVAFFALAVAPAGAQGARVLEVEIRGEQNINEQAIRSVITTRAGEEYSPERVARDRALIEAQGWFSQVTPLAQPVGNGVRVIFIVQEYPLIQQLEMTGSSVFTNQELLAAIKTRPSAGETRSVFNRITWEQDRNAIEKLYTDKGYLVNLTDNTRPEDPEYQDFLQRGLVRLRAHEIRVRQVNIEWPKREIKDKAGTVIRTEERHKTRTYVVRRALTQKEGALYSTKQTGQDFTRLRGLGFFESITPRVVPVPGGDAVDITWVLTEKRTGQVSVGAGYSPRQHLIGRAELSDQNFRGKGQGLSLSGEIGTFGGDGGPSVEVQFFEPYLTEKGTSMTVNLYNKLVYRFSRELSDNFDEDRYHERRFGGQLSLGRPFQWPVTIGFRYDDVSTGDIPRNFDFPQQDGTVYAANVSRIWNTRDYPTNPTSGTYLRLSTELGRATLDATNTGETFDNSIFDKLILDVRKYYRLKGLKATQEPAREQESQKVPVIALRFLAGSVIGDVPFFEQFFMGGAETLRGYLEDRFWGNHMYLASVEYRRPIMNRIIGVLFADVGDAFGSQSEFRFRRDRGGSDFLQHKGFRPFASIGLGLRVATPIGPIRLDFGYGEEGGRSHFSIGHAF